MTAAAAVSEKGNDGQARFRLGPDLNKDLRTSRPYFLLPLDNPVELDAARERVKQWVGSRPVTDIFILSHGWHRNFFSAVSAYDRLSSRLFNLQASGRIPVDPTTFKPLFLTLHWHSDPGENGWFDKAGRRHKDSFIANARAMFNPALQQDPNAFLRDFESLFELMSDMSAPDTDALSSLDITTRAEKYTPLLDGYSLQEAALVDGPNKAAALWTCYYEAEPRRVLLRQDRKPGAYLGMLEAPWNMLKFGVPLVGVAAVLGQIIKLPWTKLVSMLKSLGPVQTVSNGLAAGWQSVVLSVQWVLPGVPEEVLSWILGIALATTISVVYLTVTARWQQQHRKHRPGSAIAAPATVAWLCSQVILALPILSYVLITYLLGGIFGNLIGSPLEKRTHFRPWDYERLGRRDQKPSSRSGLVGWLRPTLAKIARVPTGLVQAATPDDSSMHALAETVDSQLAFYEMQHRGVQSGCRAGAALAPLLAHDKLKGARIHVMGHSFGGLLTANLVRQLAFEPSFKGKTVHSLCLLQAAMASTWFEDEGKVRGRIERLSTIYSRYDTANGFYYPTGSFARLAAGFVGLADDGSFRPDSRHCYISLVHPPTLAAPPNTPYPHAFNLDASRLIYDGPVATGGGHDDIFKDDVIHLLWAATGLST